MKSSNDKLGLNAKMCMHRKLKSTLKGKNVFERPKFGDSFALKLLFALDKENNVILVWQFYLELFFDLNKVYVNVLSLFFEQNLHL